MFEALYDNDMSQKDLDFSLACESVLLRIDRGISAHAAICEKAELDLREAELRCIQESGDVEDLTDLYMEADEKTAEKKAGVISSVWEAIKNFFNKIKNFFTGKSKEVGDNDEGQADEETLNFFQKGLAAIKSFLGKIGTGIKNLGAPKVILIALSTIAGVVGIGAIVKKYAPGKKAPEVKKAATGKLKKIFGKDAKKMQKDADAVSDQVDQVADAAADADDETSRCLAEIIKAIGAKIKEMCTKLWGSFKGKNKDHNVNKVRENNVKEYNKNKEKSETTKSAGIRDSWVGYESTDPDDLYGEEDFLFESLEDDDEDFDDIFSEATSSNIDDIMDDLDSLLGV